MNQDTIDNIQQNLTDLLQKNWKGIFNGALSITGTVGSVFAGPVIALFSLFFFLRDGRLMWLWGVKHTAGDNAERIDNAGTAAFGTLGRYARTCAFVAFIDAVGIGIGAWILGLPLALPIAIVVFLFSFIPMFGATISGAIAIAVALVDGGWKEALWMLLIVIVVQQIEGSLLYPFLFGKAASIHPMVILLSVSMAPCSRASFGAVIAVPLVSFVTTFVAKMNNPDALAPGEEVDDADDATMARTRNAAAEPSPAWSLLAIGVRLLHRGRVPLVHAHRAAARDPSRGKVAQCRDLLGVRATGPRGLTPSSGRNAGFVPRPRWSPAAPSRARRSASSRPTAPGWTSRSVRSTRRSSRPRSGR